MGRSGGSAKRRGKRPCGTTSAGRSNGCCGGPRRSSSFWRCRVPFSGRRRAGGDRSCSPSVCDVGRSSETCLPSRRARVIGSIRMIRTGAPSPSEPADDAISTSQITRVRLPPGLLEERRIAGTGSVSVTTAEVGGHHIGCREPHGRRARRLPSIVKVVPAFSPSSRRAVVRVGSVDDVRGDVRRAHVPAGRLSVPALRRHRVSQRQMFEQHLPLWPMSALRPGRQESGQARRLNSVSSLCAPASSFGSLR